MGHDSESRRPGPRRKPSDELGAPRWLVVAAVAVVLAAACAPGAEVGGPVDPGTFTGTPEADEPLDTSGDGAGTGGQGEDTGAAGEGVATDPDETAAAPGEGDPTGAGPLPDQLDFSAPLLDGGTFDVAEHDGRHVALWFWAPW